MKYINIALASSAKALDRLFTYAVPDDLEDGVGIGSIVRLPFGLGNREKRGYVIESPVQPEGNFAIKYINGLESERFLTGEQIELALWIKQFYLAPLSMVIKLMLPPSFEARAKKQVTYFLKAGPEELDQYRQKLTGDRYHKRRDLLDYFLMTQGQDLAPLSQQEFYSQAVLGTLLKDGIIGKKIGQISVLEAYKQDLKPAIREIALNSEQDHAYQTIKNNFKGIHLLHGITGSGKTQVYFKLIEDVLAAGKTAIVLVPEIALTAALVRRFLQQFGDVVGLFHSRLSDSEKLVEWDRAKRGQSKIMIGPRSALFTPLKDLGLIIIDEEHESSYKSEYMPRFHALEVAAKMTQIYQIPLVLGSATPCLETYYHAQKQKFYLHELRQKALNQLPIKVEIIDMRRELEQGNRFFLSRSLEKAIREALARQEQVILLNNRRGYAKFVSCRKCGFVYKCPHCDLAMTYHKSKEVLVCHYCDYHQPMQRICPACTSKYLKAFGMGTQKIESELKRTFPETTVIRMDYDTTRTKHGHDQQLQEFTRAKSGILVGTQMIAKGLDFHNVTVVGVLAVDQGLYTDDFRANERTFQLLTQVIGRTGRGKKPGQAFLQTYSPDHFAIQTSMSQDYQAFYQEEMVYRYLLNNPPFSRILQVTISSQDGNLLENMAGQIAKELRDLIQVKGWEMSLTGPAAPYVYKKADSYRKIILLKGKRHKELTFIMQYLYNKNINIIGFNIHMDINPQYIG